jgi:transposase-like protein
VQRFTPLFKEAARAHRRPVGGRWAVDETYHKVAGVWCYAYRAIDEHDQVIDVYVSPTRDQQAATAFFRQAINETAVTPHLVTTDKAAAYPAALQEVLPGCRHVAGKSAQQRIERDHQHLKGRLRLMRGFKQRVCAQVVCGGHAFIRNLGQGFYRLGIVMGDPRIPRPPRLVRAWDALTVELQAG